MNNIFEGFILFLIISSSISLVIDTYLDLEDLEGHNI